MLFIDWFVLLILAVISVLLAVLHNRRFVRNRRLTQPTAPATQPPSPEAS